jgi:F-type H+-transporting ATPase subunit delta
MPNPRLASRYAKSLLGLAVERDQLEEVYADMQWIEAVCKASRDFVVMLKSPVISSDKKIKITEAVTNGNIGPLTTAFNKLLITKHRESNLPEIATAFIAQYKAHKNIHTLKLTTAIPVSDQVKEAIIDQVKKTSDMKQIELITAVDDKLIGGFVLQAGDLLIDASISYDLRQVARQFDNNDFIYKVR